MSDFKPQITSTYDKNLVNFDLVASLYALIIVSSYQLLTELNLLAETKKKKLLLPLIAEDSELVLNYNLVPDRTETFLEKIVSLQVAAVNIYFLILTNLSKAPLFLYLLQEHLRDNRLFNTKLVQKEGIPPYSQYQFSSPPKPEWQFMLPQLLEVKPVAYSLKFALSLWLAEAVEVYLQNFYQQLGFFIQDSHQLTLENEAQIKSLNYLAWLKVLSSNSLNKLQFLTAIKEVALFLLRQQLKVTEAKFKDFFHQAEAKWQNHLNNLQKELKESDEHAYEEILRLTPLIKAEKMQREKLTELMKVKVTKEALLKSA